MAIERKHELDWLRVLAFFLLIFFHSGMAFVEFPWHIKNGETSGALTSLWGFFHSWRMPLLFLVSGAGIYFAMKKRSANEFLLERTKRLLLPLAFGILVIIPPQVYLERLTQGVDFSSFIDFYPHFFEGNYLSAPFTRDNGNFSPHHLWFIGSLFVYCLLLLPVFLLLKTRLGKSLLNGFSTLCQKPFGIYVAAVPIYAGNTWIGGEFVFNAQSLLLIFLGYVLVSSPVIMTAIEQQRRQSLLLTFSLNLILYWMYFTPDYFFTRWQINLVSAPALVGILYSLLGYAKHYLNHNNKVLSYCNEGVYPFYILHQTITVIIVYHLIQIEMNMWSKFIITVVGTALFTLMIYHFMIRPFNWVRPLFGLTPKQQSQQTMLPTTVRYN